MKGKKAIKYCNSDRVFIGFDTLLLIFIFIIILYPLLFVFMSSFNGGMVLKGLSLIPRYLSLEGYKAVIEYNYVWSGYKNSIIYTLLYTVLSTACTILCAYPLSRNEFKFGKIAMGLCVFTMYFGGGLIPTYIWIKKLGLLNSIWAIILPGMLSVYNMIVMRTYFAGQIPKDLYESAQLDGCGQWRYLISIVLPLSGAVIAVVALYYGVGKWNSYFDAMVYLQDRTLLPLQNILREIMIVNTSNSLYSDVEAQARAEERAELVKYCMIVVSTIPMMIIYPFVQRFFVKGVMLGSVKG